jgi:hypothetical protein
LSLREFDVTDARHGDAPLENRIKGSHNREWNQRVYVEASETGGCIEHDAEAKAQEPRPEYHLRKAILVISGKDASAKFTHVIGGFHAPSLSHKPVCSNADRQFR